MSTLRISDAPLLPDVDGTEKIPTGGRGDYAISVDQIKGHIFQDIGKELVGLGNVDNTSDLDKPVSTAQQAALNLKADKTYVDNNLDLKADKTNVYTRTETTFALSNKADLVNGVVPENQIPSSFNDVLEFTTTNLPIVGESGKIYVTTDTNKTWRWGGNKYVEISGWNPDSVSKRVTIPTYNNSSDGVDPVIGVAAGAYFNVRSSLDDTVLVEYQNVGGVPTTTGKSYPSGSYVENIAKYTPLPFKDARSYALYERVQLNNGNIAKSTVANNTANPNIDMTGWFDAEDYLLKGRTGIDPDYFEGTDVQKLQQAYDAAYATGGRVVDVVLGRRYDVTGGSIFITPDYFKRPIVKFHGGEIYKGDAGFIIDRAASNMSADAPRFYGTGFQGEVPETYIFNCTKMIRPVAFYCDYNKISFAKSDSYIQSIRILGGESSFQLSSFIKARNLFDPRVGFLQGEASENSFLELSGNGVGYTITGGNFSNNLIEGYTVPPFVLGSTLGTEFDGNYFENMPSVFKFIPRTGDLQYFQASFNNNMVAHITGDCAFDATDRGDITVLQFTSIENNGMTGWSDPSLTADTRFMVKGAILYRRGGKPNYFTQGGTESNIRTQTWQVGVVLAKTVQIPSGNGIRAVIGGINTDSAVRLVDVATKPLLVSISGQMASGSPTYRFSTVGVLTFEVSFVGGQLVDRVVFKPIQHGAIAGNNNGATGTDADFSCVWADTGTATRPHGALIDVENQVFINLPNTYYASASASVSAVPISSIVAETSSTFLPNISRG